MHLRYILLCAWLAFASSCAFAHERDAIDTARSGLGEPVAGAENPYDESLWVVTDSALLVHFTRDGSLVQGVALSSPASAVAVDLDESVWVAVGGEVVHFSPRAELLATRPLGFEPGERATALAIDPFRERVWIGTSRGLYVSDSSAVTRSLDGDVRSLALDPRDGRVVAIVDAVLVSILDRDIRAGTFVSFAADEQPGAVNYDASRNAFVIVSGDRSRLVDVETAQLKEDVQQPATAVPFRIDPWVELVRPPDGGAISSATAEIVVRVGARCNDVPCELPAYVERMRVEAMLDEARLAQVVVDANGYARWATPLPAHASHFVVRAIDRFGHRASARGRWTPVASGDPATQSTTDPPTNDVAATQTKAANKPPVVTLTSPLPGSVITAAHSMQLTANASDPDGSIAKVEFYRGGSTLIGTATASPYAVTWAPAAGSYSLTAKAYDNRNGTAVSSAVPISVVDNQAPSVAIKSPRQGDYVRIGSTSIIVAEASDPDGTVVSMEFFDATTSLGVVRTPPFQLQWTPTWTGMHAVFARATDDHGATTNSPAVDVVVGEAPVVVVTNPAACAIVDGPANLYLNADAMSTTGYIVRVEFFDNGTLVGSTTAYPWQVVLQDAQRGTHSIVARATDDRGGTTTSRAAEVSVRAPNEPPTVALTSPSNGTHLPVASRVDLVASANDADGPIKAVEFRLGSAGATLIERVTMAPFTATWTPSSSGTYSLVAVAIDDRNASTTSNAVQVIVDPNVLPTVSLTAPAPNARFAAPANVVVTANANDTDGSVTKVEFFSGGTLIGTSTSAPYTLTWSNVAAGTYSLTARATDNAGGLATSAAVAITVAANAAPTVSLTSSTAGPYFAPATIGLIASASDSDGTIVRVEFYANGALIGTATSAPYAMVWDAVQGGSYAITAKAIDDAGAGTTSAPVNVFVQAAPTLNFDGTLGTTIVDDDNVLVSGYVSAPANSAVTVNGVVTHIDDRGFFQANDVPLTPGTNEIVAVVTSQDGQTVTKSVTVESSGAGLFVVKASPTEGIETLQVTFTVENPRNSPFKQVLFDLDNDGFPNLIAYPNQFRDGKLTVTATYPAGTWLATITFLDDQDRVIYQTRKSIVVLHPQIFQGNVRAIYENMLLRLRAGNVPAALTAFTGSAYEKYNEIFTQLQPDLAQIVDQLGTVTEITFNLDMAELTLMRNSADGAQKFMIYLIRSEDGIWRIDGM